MSMRTAINLSNSLYLRSNSSSYSRLIPRVLPFVDESQTLAALYLRRAGLLRFMPVTFLSLAFVETALQLYRSFLRKPNSFYPSTRSRRRVFPRYALSAAIASWLLPDRRRSRLPPLQTSQFSNQRSSSVILKDRRRDSRLL